MRYADAEFIRFDAQDVITTSGETVYKFKGLGSDVNGDGDKPFSISVGGNDVTDVYANSMYGVNANDGKTVYTLAERDNYTYIETKTSEELGKKGIKDGSYTLGCEPGLMPGKFSPMQ